jgi:hypothetical protein
MTGWSHITALLRAPVRIAAGALLLAMMGVPALAEVSVVTDSTGRYHRTLFLSGIREGNRIVWGQIRNGVDPAALLNPTGDRFGDGIPAIGERPGSRQPWVLWSASDGGDREIAFATWTGGHWFGPRLLEVADNTHDDIHPRLGFDPEGRPVAVWQRNEPVPRVYLSLFRDGAWTPALALSDPALPARFPSLRVQGNRAVVTFFTPKGQTVLFQDLDAIVHPPGFGIEGNGPMDGPVPPPGREPSGDDSPQRRRTTPKPPGEAGPVLSPTTND